MRLAAPHGQSFELRILAYQFPEGSLDRDDANWLLIECAVTHPRGKWSFRDPCLETFDIPPLASWLESVAQGSSPCRQQEFMEPNLRFELVATPPNEKLRVHFDLEARPPWAASDPGPPEDLWVEFPVSPPELNQAAASLREQLKQYPSR